MKRIAIVAAAVLALILFAAGFYLWPALKFVHYMSVQMKFGQKYMDSLTEGDFRTWTARTRELLSSYDPKAETVGTYGLGGKAIPADLEKLKILRIDVYDSNTVCYVWLGGMDHTELEVQRMDDRVFTFTAHYNDQSNRVLWPKK